MGCAPGAQGLGAEKKWDKYLGPCRAPPAAPAQGSASKRECGGALLLRAGTSAGETPALRYNRARRRKGSGDSPGLQSRRFDRLPAEWWVRLPHASAKGSSASTHSATPAHRLKTRATFSADARRSTPVASASRRRRAPQPTGPAEGLPCPARLLEAPDGSAGALRETGSGRCGRTRSDVWRRHPGRRNTARRRMKAPCNPSGP